MTKLMQCLLLTGIFLSVWLPLATNKLNNSTLERYSDFFVLLPVISIVFFGIYALAVILWRVFTFNNCEAAADELKSQIIEARKDLEQKGFIFK